MRHKTRPYRFGVIGVAVLLLGLAALAGTLLSHTRLLDPFRYQFSAEPLRLGMAEAVETLDPVRMNQRGEKMVGINLYEGLIGYDPASLDPRPGLAAAWEVSDDARVFYFRLRKDACFHSGRPVTAEDVKYSWERNLDLRLEASSAHLLEPIIGVAEKVQGKAAGVAGIEVLDPQKIRVTLGQPDTGFLSRLGMPAFWVVDREAVEAAGAEFGRPGNESAGTGPFKLREWQKNKPLVLEASANYWGSKILLSQVEFYQMDPREGLESFKAGKIDYLDEVPAPELKQILQDPALAPQVQRAGLLASYYYQFNFQDPVWGASSALRQAVNYALDREAMLDRLFNGNGRPLQSLMPAGFRRQNWEPVPYQFDPAKAKLLLAEAGYPEGKGLPALELAYNDLESHRVIAQELQQQLELAGISVKLRPMPWDRYQADLAAGRYQAFRAGWSWEYPDPGDLFVSNFHSAQIGRTNYSFYRNQWVDDQLAAASLENNPKKRLAGYQQIEKQITADAPLLWLFAWERVVLVSPRVYNLQITALDLATLQFVGLLADSD